MALDKFKMWTVDKLSEHTNLSEIKAQKGTLRLIYMLAIFFLSANIFWSTSNRSMKILLMPFIYETVASIVKKLLPEYVSDQAKRLVFSNFGKVVSVFNSSHEFNRYIRNRKR